MGSTFLAESIITRLNVVGANFNCMGHVGYLGLLFSITKICKKTLKRLGGRIQ